MHPPVRDDGVVVRHRVTFDDDGCKQKIPAKVLSFIILGYPRVTGWLCKIILKLHLIEFLRKIKTDDMAKVLVTLSFIGERTQ